MDGIGESKYNSPLSAVLHPVITLKLPITLRPSVEGLRHDGI